MCLPLPTGTANISTGRSPAHALLVPLDATATAQAGTSLSPIRVASSIVFTAAAARSPAPLHDCAICGKPLALSHID